ncbi:hypothetical protein C7E12_20760, partial [Stenotrophomonas maltophilia]
TLQLAPSYDFQALGNHALQGGSGVHGEWQYALARVQCMTTNSTPACRRLQLAQCTAHPAAGAEL